MIRVLRRALIVYALVFPLVFAYGFAVQWSRTDTVRDVATYYRAAGQSVDPGMYEPLPPPGKITGHGIPLYPPPIFAALRPLSRLPFVWFARAWLVVLAAAFWAYAAGCSRILRGHIDARAMLTVGALVGSTPAFVLPWNVGNVDILLWALVAVGLAYSGVTRGASLALGAALKVMPVWALAFAVRERRAWRGVGYAVAGCVALMLVTLGPAGMWSECWTWLARIAPAVSAGEQWERSVVLGPTVIPRWMMPDNASLTNAIAPLFGPLAGAWMLLTGIGAPILAGVLLRKRTVAEQAAGVLAATVIFGPILRVNYLPLLVPCALVWWKLRNQPATSPNVEALDAE